MGQPEPSGAKEALVGSVTVHLIDGVEAASTGDSVYLTIYGVWVYSPLGATRVLYPWHQVASVSVH